MGFLQRAVRASKAGTSSLSNPSGWLIDIFGTQPSLTGINVSEVVALNSTAVYACVNILAQTLSTLPLVTYQRQPDGGKRRATEHPLYYLLHDQANPEMTSSEVRETLAGHLALWGNAYAEIERDRLGRPIAIWPLRPDRMQIYRDPSTFRLDYQYSLYTGGVAHLAPEDVLHVKSLNIDSIRGASPIGLNKESIALDLALEQFASALFGNSSTPGGVLQHPGELSKEAHDRMKASWEESHRGLSNAHRVAILEEGTTWQATGIPPEAAQFLGTRTFQLNEIARIWRIPPHLLGELTRSTNNNIEHQSIEFVTHTVRPLAVKWEQQMAMKLFMPSERQEYFAEFLIDGLLRGDLASRYAAYAVGRQWGWLSADDIRALENMNPLPDDEGQVYLNPLNMVPSNVPLPLVKGATDTTDQTDEADESGANRSLDFLRPVLADAVGRILRREEADLMRLSRKAKGDGLEAAIRGFYAGHGEYVVDQLAPVLASLGELGSVAPDASRMATAHCNRRMAVALDALASGEGLQRHFDETREQGGADLMALLPNAVPMLSAAPVMEMRSEPPPPAVVHVNFNKDSFRIEAPMTIAEGAFRSENPVTFAEGMVKVDAATTIAEGAIQTTTNVPERSVTVDSPVTIAEGAIQAGATNVTVEAERKKGFRILRDRNNQIVGSEPTED